MGMLQECLDGLRELQELEDRLAEALDGQLRVTAHYGGYEGGRTGGDRMLAAIARCDQLERQLDRARARQRERTAAAARLIKRFPRMEARIAKLIYLEGLSVNKTARQTGYSRSSVYGAMQRILVMESRILEGARGAPKI
jgi:DNA invertase Pin-like site-specific DNA recombinase